jgi:hypothetical protein
MAGYNLIQKIHRLEEQVDRLGFMMCHSRHSYNNEFGDVLALKPKDQDSLPIYSRDAELFVGTVQDLEQFLKGIEFARQYDSMLFGRTHDKNRTRKEQDERNKQLMRKIKGKEKETETV